jgi:hypothetical protein
MAEHPLAANFASALVVWLVDITTLACNTLPVVPPILSESTFFGPLLEILSRNPILLVSPHLLLS